MCGIRSRESCLLSACGDLACANNEGPGFSVVVDPVAPENRGDRNGYFTRPHKLEQPLNVGSRRLLTAASTLLVFNGKVNRSGTFMASSRHSELSC